MAFLCGQPLHPLLEEYRVDGILVILSQNVYTHAGDRKWHASAEFEVNLEVNLEDRIMRC